VAAGCPQVCVGVQGHTWWARTADALLLLLLHLLLHLLLLLNLLLLLLDLLLLLLDLLLLLVQW
jgi:hypothetical protein